MFIVFFVLLLSSSLAFALDDQGNPNDPTINDRANACYEDGSMADKCDTQVEWDAGYFLIRFEYGILSREEIPIWVAWVLPPEIIPEELAAVVAPVVPTTCTIQLLAGSLAYAWFGSSIEVSINTVMGNNSGGTPGAYWGGSTLWYGDGTRSSFIWDGSWRAGTVGTTDCPTPTPFTP